MSSDTATRVSGDSWIRPVDGMVMVYVPGGKFEMGSADHGAYAMHLCKQYYGDCLWDSYRDEGPAHPVVVEMVSGSIKLRSPMVTTGAVLRQEDVLRPPETVHILVSLIMMTKPMMPIR
jgi:hypothetical protein